MGPLTGFPAMGIIFNNKHFSQTLQIWDSWQPHLLHNFGSLRFCLPRLPCLPNGICFFSLFHRGEARSLLLWGEIFFTFHQDAFA